MKFEHSDSVQTWYDIATGKCKWGESEEVELEFILWWTICHNIAAISFLLLYLSFFCPLFIPFLFAISASAGPTSVDPYSRIENPKYQWWLWFRFTGVRGKRSTVLHAYTVYNGITFERWVTFHGHPFKWIILICYLISTLIFLQ